jgi:hypothetical protein
MKKKSKELKTKIKIHTRFNKINKLSEHHFHLLQII